MRRTRIRLSVAIAALLLSVGVAPASAQATATDTARRAETAAQEPVPLSVVTYNIHFGYPDCDLRPPGECVPNPVEAAGAILDLAPDVDVVMLQEVDQFHPDSLCDNQPREISQVLAEATGTHPWDLVMGQNSRRSTEGTICEDQAPYSYRGNAILTRHEILSTENLPLPQPGGDSFPCPVTRPDQNPTTAQRCVLSARISVPRAGTVQFYTTHLEARDDVLRSDQVEYLIENWDPEGDDPRVLAGDFNLEPQDSLHNDIEADGWIDTRIELLMGRPDCPGNGIAGCTYPSEPTPRRRIDYVFHSPGMQRPAFTLESSSTASDHRPVHMILNLPPA